MTTLEKNGYRKCQYCGRQRPKQSMLHYHSLPAMCAPGWYCVEITNCRDAKFEALTLITTINEYDKTHQNESSNRKNDGIETVAKPLMARKTLSKRKQRKS